MLGDEDLASIFARGDPDRQAVVGGVKNGTEVRLRTWEKDVIVSSLEECLEQMAAILQRNNLKKTGTNLNFVPTDVRYLDLIKSRLLYTSEERAIKDMETEAVFQKLTSDSTKLVNILENTVQELRSSGSFQVLTTIPKSFTDAQTEEYSILTKAEKNNEEVKRLRELIAQERIANESERRKCVEKLSTVLREMEAQQAKGRASIAYVSAWEKARCEQNIARCRFAEKDLRRTLEKLEIDEKNENRITGDIEAFLCDNIAENEELTIGWEKRHDREWTEYTNEIGRLEKKIKLEKTALELLKEEQREKRSFIDTYLAEKEADRRKKELEEHVRKSTIKIQAWWRGVMVRQKFGPYRPEEKKKKRPAKSKK
ncbi:dynein regulatory complex protein 9-like [Neodiprion virginianus]|uniref:dynein regulatory complex protein 9-like n=1 Tax=Neodiprion virginianus TaxID=2961670 RepID=UPI001EE77C88|nr:dynein regulatory complex protein 9-like [Neodiprion virginianus]